MAKTPSKTSKQSSTRATSRSAASRKATTRKAGASKAAAGKAAAGAKKAPGAAARRGPAGRGPGPAEIGRDLVNRVNLGQFQEIYDQWYHPTRIESVEGDGQKWKGMKGLKAKNQWWYSNHDIHSCSADGPFVGATGFTVHYTMSFTPKGGSRVDMAEVGIYTVKDGKIVREEYMYRQS